MYVHRRSFEFLSGNALPNGPLPWDHVLFESRNFVAIPTLGALVEGSRTYSSNSPLGERA